MRDIHFHRTLFYYDGPQVFEARDGIGGHYLGVMVPDVHDSLRERCLVVGVPPEQLRRFRVGAVDLRTLLEAAQPDLRYLGSMPAALNDPFALNLLDTPSIDESLLPGPGFLLDEDPAEDELVREARQRNNLVLRISVEPPESATEHRIRSTALAELLHRVQVVVRRAHAVVRAGAPSVARSADEATLDVVVPAAAGSFEFMLEARAADLFGSRLRPAMEMLDTLFADTENTERASRVAQQHRGHLAGAYLRLLRFLTQQDTGLRYAWAEPDSERSSSHGVSSSAAYALVDVLSTVEDLGSEQLSLVGSFARFDRRTGEWGLETDGGMRRGKMRDPSQSLDGLQVGEHYTFHCVEEIEQAYVTGKERRTLYLRRIERTGGPPRR